MMSELVRGMAKLQCGKTIDTAEEWFVVLGNTGDFNCLHHYEIAPVSISTGKLLGSTTCANFDPCDMGQVLIDYCFIDWRWVEPGAAITCDGRKAKFCLPLEDKIYLIWMDNLSSELVEVDRGSVLLGYPGE